MKRPGHPGDHDPPRRRPPSRPVEGLRLVHVVARRPGDPAPASRACHRRPPPYRAATRAADRQRSRPGAGWAEDEERYALVCTNGRHDACCATYGRPLVRACGTGPGLRDVWECSHIGGDRFAGNLVVLPESLYFGRCRSRGRDPLLGGLDEGRLDLENFRGRSALRWPSRPPSTSLGPSSASTGSTTSWRSAPSRTAGSSSTSPTGAKPSSRSNDRAARHRRRSRARAPRVVLLGARPRRPRASGLISTGSADRPCRIGCAFRARWRSLGR